VVGAGNEFVRFKTAFQETRKDFTGTPAARLIPIRIDNGLLPSRARMLPMLAELSSHSMIFSTNQARQPGFFGETAAMVTTIQSS
jgi:hypothetical protein